MRCFRPPPSLKTAIDPAAEDQTSVGTGASDGGEIIVTARRRSETAQSVPLAISVIGGEHIDNTGSFNVGRSSNAWDYALDEAIE